MAQEDMIAEAAELDLEELAALAEAEPDLLTDEEEALIYEDAQPRDGEFYANLAEDLDDTALATLAQQVIDWHDDDEESRQDWRDREAKGIRKLGVTEQTEGGADFKGAAKVVHPMLIEACVQFQSRAIAETWPASGPCRAIVLGQTDEEREEQAQRVADYINYLYTEEMPGGFEEHDQMLFRLPLSGSAFKQIYYCPLEQKILSRYVHPEDMVVPYLATNLRSAARYTHVVKMTPSDVKRMQASGVWRDVDLLEPMDHDRQEEDLDDAIDDAEGRSEIRGRTDDQEHTVYHQYVYLSLPGIDDDVPYERPYRVTVERDSQTVLAVYRNWAEDDENERPLCSFAHYKFLPGLGFYGFGYLHVIGGLSDAATGSLRALLDAGMFANMQGGYRSKDARIMGGDTPLSPGEWREVSVAAEDLAKAFFKVPYGEPSSVLFNLLGSIDELGRRMASTTEASVGEGSQAMPVGTILARIEQGAKIYSAIHKRLHVTLKYEFKVVHRLCRDNLPEEGYPYQVPGAEREIAARDFDDRVDVVPVSDPNMVSSTHRIMQAQLLLELANQAPELYEREEVHEFMLVAMRVPDHERFLRRAGAVKRRDPVSEGVAMMTGQPAKAFYDQDHGAHLATHERWFMSLPPEFQQAAEPAYMAHVAEHLSWLYWLQMQQATGGALPLPEQDDEDELSAEEEAQLAAIIGQAVQQMPPPQTPQQQQAQAEAQEMEAEVERKNAAAAAEIERKDMLAEREAARKDFLASLDAERSYTQSELDALRQELESQEQSRRQDAETVSKIERERAMAAARATQQRRPERGGEE